jgi:hypothetical protein
MIPLPPPLSPPPPLPFQELANQHAALPHVCFIYFILLISDTD